LSVCPREQALRPTRGHQVREFSASLSPGGGPEPGTRWKHAPIPVGVLGADSVWGRIGVAVATGLSAGRLTGNGQAGPQARPGGSRDGI
jgi:hypothetical protein